jgi:hypothetical protein
VDFSAKCFFETNVNGLSFVSARLPEWVDHGMRCAPGGTKFSVGKTSFGSSRYGSAALASKGGGTGLELIVSRGASAQIQEGDSRILIFNLRLASPSYWLQPVAATPRPFAPASLSLESFSRAARGADTPSHNARNAGFFRPTPRHSQSTPKLYTRPLVPGSE